MNEMIDNVKKLVKEKQFSEAIIQAEVNFRKINIKNFFDVVEFIWLSGL